jgi:hypothetical protein
MRGRAMVIVVVGARVSVGAGIGDGAPEATRGCVGGDWWTCGHPTPWRAVSGAVVGVGALVGTGVDGGDWGWAEHIGGEGGAMVA